MKSNWTRRSYDALHEWGDKAKREAIIRILRADGLDSVIDRLQASKTMGVWYGITREAAESVGADVVEASAKDAEKELGKTIEIPKLKCLRCDWEWQPRTDDVRMCPNPECRSPKWDVPKKPK